MKIITSFIASFLLFLFTGNASAQSAGTFPQKEINSLSALANQQIQNHSLLLKKEIKDNASPVRTKLRTPYSNGAEHSVMNVLQTMSSGKFSIPVKPDTVSLGDTLFIGLTPNDTLRITGNWTHIGSIVVIGDGVLIFDNANATILGNIYVVGNGKAFSDSSYLYLPQQWWYQRWIAVAQNGYLNFSNTTFNYGGYPHSFVAVDSAVVVLSNITNNDYTTTGMNNNASITINGNNLTGEFIITESVNLYLKNTTGVLLWHQFPDTAVINHTFPNGNVVNSYLFNKNAPGVSGINYNITVDTCYNIQWALMPTGGSDVTISNSTIRSIGLWFEGNDTSNVSGLVNNSNYSNFTAPLSDRNLHFINTSVACWSIYPMDSAVVNISGCIVGEVGALGHSIVQGTNYLVDGSGGYCFTTDTSFMYNGFCSVSSNVRSEGNSIHVFAYSTQSNGIATAIGTSILAVMQSTLPQDPVPYEKSCVWFANITQPSTAYVDSIVSIIGSAWIDKTAISPWMDFSSYRVWYQKAGDTIWTAVNNPVITEVRNSTIALWNTYGLTPGLYNLRLEIYDNWGDSLDAVKQVNLLPAILVSAEDILQNEISLTVYPTISNGEFNVQMSKWEDVQMKIYNVFGECIKQHICTSARQQIDLGNHPSGIYFLQITTNKFSITKKLEIIK